MELQHLCLECVEEFRPGVIFPAELFALSDGHSWLLLKSLCCLVFILALEHQEHANPGGVLPYKGLMGTCGQPGYVFRDFCLEQGIEFIIICLNQGIDLSIFV